MKVVLFAAAVSAVMGYETVMTKLTLNKNFGENPTHYGDPSGGCMSDEMAVQVTGIDGDFCSPQCSNGSCPTDLPKSVTAAAQCALQTGDGSQYCALICDPNASSNQCGTGSCKPIQGTGLCTYDDR